MHPQKLNELRDELLARAKEIMDAKQKEYATPENCLSNFDGLSVELGKSPETIAYEYLAKHVLSIGALCRKIDAGGYFNAITDGLTEKPESRLMDVINYCVFMYIMYERRKKGMNP